VYIENVYRKCGGKWKPEVAHKFFDSNYTALDKFADFQCICVQSIYSMF